MRWDVDILKKLKNMLINFKLLLANAYSYVWYIYIALYSSLIYYTKI